MYEKRREKKNSKPQQQKQQHQLTSQNWNSHRRNRLGYAAICLFGCKNIRRGITQIIWRCTNKNRICVICSIAKMRWIAWLGARLFSSSESKCVVHLVGRFCGQLPIVGYYLGVNKLRFKSWLGKYKINDFVKVFPQISVSHILTSYCVNREKHLFRSINRMSSWTENYDN